MMLGVVQFQINASKNLNTLHSFTVDFGGNFVAEDFIGINSILNTGIDLPNVLLIRTSRNEPMLIGFRGENNDRWYVHDEGRELSSDDEQLVAKNVVISPGLYNRPDFSYANYPLVIAEHTFNIVGIGIIPQNNLFFVGADLYEKYYPQNEQVADVYNHEHDHDEEDIDYVKVIPQYQTILMPFSTFHELGYRVDIATFMHQYSSLEEFEDFSTRLSITFPNAEIHQPTTPKEYYSSDMQRQLIQALLLICAALINIAALFVYWLSVNKRVHGVYMLCGATRIKVISLMFIEWSILVLVSFLLSFCIEILTTPIFMRIGVTFDFSIQQTILMLVGGYIATVIFMLPQIFKNANLNQRGYVL
jgi:hypothetical protein